jgi:transposase
MENFQIPSKRPKMGPLSVNEKTLILNCYNFLSAKNASASVDGNVELAATMLGVSKSSVYKMIKENKTSGVQPPLQSPGRPSVEIEDDLKQGLRRKVHSFFFKKEFPTLDKILVAVQEDSDYPRLSRSTLWKILKSLGFQWKKHNRKSILIDRPDIVAWRRDFLRKIRQCRNENKQIYYLDETWLNAGHTVSKCWQDSNIKSRRQA